MVTAMKFHSNTYLHINKKNQNNPKHCCSHKILLPIDISWFSVQADHISIAIGQVSLLQQGDMLAQQLSCGGELQQYYSSNLPSSHFLALCSQTQCRAVNQTGSWNRHMSLAQAHQSPIKSKQIRTGSEAGELQMKECAIGGRDLGSCEQECQRNQALQKRVMWQTWYLLAKLTAYKPGFCGLRGSIRSL